jgi:hypothetical protein
MGPHSPVLDALGAIAAIAFLGFLGGYFGAVITLVRNPDTLIDPIRAGEHGSAWVGMLAALVVLVSYL